MKRSGPIRRKKRSAAEFQRAYGGVDRLAWLHGLFCLVCETTPCEAAHVGSGGMGRKADAEFTVPLCHRHHMELHAVGIKTFAQAHRIDLVAEAARVALAWEAEKERPF